MSNIQIPSIIESYFAAKSGANPNDLATIFDNDATIRDNGEDHVITGLANIKTWLANTSAKYKMTSEVTEVTDTSEGSIAKVIVTGDFPGSPYEFSYRFQLSNGKIKELDIDPIGSLAP